MYGFIHDVIAEKGGQVLTVSVSATVREAVRQMNEAGIGALVTVSREGRLAGIFSERDVLRRVVDQGRDPDRTRVTEVMTTPVVTIAPAMPVDDAMQMMTRERVRHLPVVLRGELIGMISIGDLLRWVSRSQEADIAQMKDYITGSGTSV